MRANAAPGHEKGKSTRTMKRLTLAASLSMSMALAAMAQGDVRTRVQYLRGHGSDDMVQWEFQCTGGNNSGKWTTIGVPSCWELQGFGTYQYGVRISGKASQEGIADEKGMYRYSFTLPKEWENHHIDLVFEGSMTDTEVTINKRKAGPVHQGAFYRITYDVTDRVYFGSRENLLEVTVSKESENEGVNLAERRADYWNFGGIFRPVFIVCKPAVNIERTAIDARADGTFNAYVLANRALEGARVRTTITDMDGRKVAEEVTDIRTGSDHADVALKVDNPRTWTAETPNRYRVEFALEAGERTLHVETDRFGFRTIETREGDGLYINGTKVNIRGCNRHSFWPETGRTLSRQRNIDDVNLIKSMNMNAVRLSHYPADPDFYDACDSLGLYVMSELSGWHGHHETINGQKLVKEMVTRDVNHPCIIWWSNGNEGGWNTELDGEFHVWDIQKRPVLHPQGNFSGYETMHYRSYGETEEYMRKPEIFMPTEFLHALYDGGAGAGLHDYWELMRSWPRCAGGFIWAYADEGVVRTDMGGIIDNVGNYAADGIVGPHHEREGSYHTVRQVWCPVQVSMPEGFDGTLDVENRYDFLSLDDCRFDYSYVAFEGAAERTLKGGAVDGVPVRPGSRGTIALPAPPDGAEALRVAAWDRHGQELFTWVFKLRDSADPHGATAGGSRPTIDGLTVRAGNVTYTFSESDGTLNSVGTPRGEFHFGGGPRFFAYRRSDRSFDQFYNHDDSEAEKKKTTYTAYEDQGTFTGIDVDQTADGDTLVVTANYALGSLRKAEWHIAPDGTARLAYTYDFNGVVDLMGIAFDLPEGEVKGKRWLGDGPYRVWKNRLHGPQLGIWENEYNDPVPGESFTYPEFKGYFAGVQWMELQTGTGTVTLRPDPDNDYVGVYQPRDGRDGLLYTLPETGISIMQVIPAVRNKVNTTDLNGPSAQPVWARGRHEGSVTLHFE